VSCWWWWLWLFRAYLISSFCRRGRRPFVRRRTVVCGVFRPQSASRSPLTAAPTAVASRLRSNVRFRTEATRPSRSCADSYRWAQAGIQVKATGFRVAPPVETGHMPLFNGIGCTSRSGQVSPNILGRAMNYLHATYIGQNIVSLKLHLSNL